MMDVLEPHVEVVHKQHSLNQGVQIHGVPILAQKQTTPAAIIQPVQNGNPALEQLIFHQHIIWEILSM